MPESNAAGGPELRLSDDIVKEPLPSQNPDIYTPARGHFQSPSEIPEIGSEVGFINDQALGGNAVNARSEQDSSKTGNGTRSDGLVSGQSIDTYTSKRDEFDNGLTSDKPHTETVSSLSLTGQTTRKASVPSSLQHVKGESGLDDHTIGPELDHGFDSQQDMRILPAFGLLDRTNSFPAVPDLPQGQNDHGPKFSLSQAESIVEQEEHSNHSAQGGFDAGEAQYSAKTMDLDEPDLFKGVASVEEHGFFDYPIGTETGRFPISPTDDEARFEEGLPLVPPSLTEQIASPVKPNPMTDLSSSHQNFPAEEFFGNDSNSSQEASFFEPKGLDRKTTSQVLHGMADVPYDAHSSQTMNSLSAEATTQKEEDLAALWQAALDDDDLLDDVELPADEPNDSAEVEVTTTSHASPSQTSYGSSASGNSYAPTSTQQTTASPLYQNHNPTGHQSQSASTHSLSHSSSAPAGFGPVTLQQLPQSNVPSMSRPAVPAPAQSFADKSKGGYISPYDLPMDVNRPKRRTNLQQVQTVSNPQTSSRPLAPPRSSSMYVSEPPAHSLPPPLPPLPNASPSLPPARPSSSNVKPKPSMGSFFEELPATKSRPSSTASRHAPAAPQQQLTQLPLRSEPPRLPSPNQRPPSSFSNTASDYQLVSPERQSPYANLPQQMNTTSAPVQATSRYSPTPNFQSNVPPSRNRYAVPPAAAVPRPPASSQAAPFQPRTSSPLAQNSTVSQQAYHVSPPPANVTEGSRIPQRKATIQRHDPQYDSSGLSHVEEHFDPIAGRNAPGIASNRSSTESRSAHHSNHSQLNLGYGPTQSSPSNSGFSALTPESEAASTNRDLQPQYLNESQAQSHIAPGDDIVGPPRRPQTQSPGIARPKLDPLIKTKDVHQRPASAIAGSSYSHVESPASSQYAPTTQISSHSTQDLNYIRPNDGREHDPFERWKGGPIVKFGFGGTVVTSFPKHIPRYAAGHGFPMIKCSPGEVKLRIGNNDTLEDGIASFPGPLKSKSKKKELLEWLQKKVDILESFQATVMPSPTLPDPIKRHEEKILLWKIMKIFVQYDGNVARNDKAENAVRTILCPDLVQNEGTEASLAGSGRALSGISKSNGSQSMAEPVDLSAMESIRRLLLQGEREKAVWHAVDRRMWAHAMVLASTLDKSVWKQVLHEFTRLEVKPSGENTESLAALYEVFTGNWEESIDELVPPSARAGLQMVSKAASTGPTRNALDGLDRWRETLTLILSNRTQDDENALTALGRLLAGYGRIEAAHLCLVFAKSTGLFGSIEDAQASVILLGADHQQQPFDYGRDLDSILLTEVYEFTYSVLASSTSLSVSPHLQSYKLYHAMLLAESGYRSESQQYCDAIMSTLKSTTKPSPYFHSLLFMALDDLVERLQQAPRDGSSWMSKPMDKMSGSVWKRLNNFIVGDESETGSVSTGKGDQDAGPFARVTADALTVSRSASSTDLYGAQVSPPGPFLPAPTAFGSRYAPSSHYAPSGQYTPRSSLEQQGRASEELQRPAQPSKLQPTQPQVLNHSNASGYTSSPAPRQDHSSQSYKPTYQPSAYDSPNSGGYLPTPPLQPDHMPIEPPADASSSMYLSELVQSSAAPEPPPDMDHHHTYEPPSSMYNPNASAYEPPSSYTRYDPEGQDSQSPTDDKSPKQKKSFMDDEGDDDFAARAAAVLREDDKARKDREANEAIRKAAEADGMVFHQLITYIETDFLAAQRDNKPKKSSWFGGVGGWLGGKKDDNLSSQEPKAIKAKLGEESSFYYDKELKKWVNKKSPTPAASEASKPPPPRGPPSRAVSGAGGPPMSRTATPPVPPLPSMLRGQMGTPPTGVSHPPSGSGTPARRASPGIMPAQAATHDAVSSGPLSAPPSRPSTAVGGGGGGGIDDLLGEPQVRKGGTMKRGKKGRGYVDVMAK
ncbi:MAG: hypothetical protein Q9213_000082 [Squamulea squamosa]